MYRISIVAEDGISLKSVVLWQKMLVQLLDVIVVTQ